MTERILQIIPANPGTRHVRANLWFWKGNPAAPGLRDLPTAPDEQLVHVDPVVCWALVEWDAGGEIARRVAAIGFEDLPTVLWIIDEDSRSVAHVGYLAPGEEMNDYYREEARSQIVRYAGAPG